MAKHRKTQKKTTAAKGSRKERITITIDKALLEWIDKRIQEKVFANRSHAIEYITTQAQK
ncbi:MAG: ribbon-helix-helix domain-containing protein [Desulfosalsimonas sp.]